MDPPSLFERRPPWVIFTRPDDRWLNTETARLQRSGGNIIRLNGFELTDPASLFSTFARELDFPSYFGRNWDALADCLHDWHAHGLSSKDVAVLIDHADELVGKAFLGLLVAVLCQASWHANFQVDADRLPNEYSPPFTMHFVFVLDGISPSSLIEAAGGHPEIEATLQGDLLTATLIGADWPDLNPAAH